MDLILASSLANTLMKEHGIIEKGWKFKFDNAKRRFGVCKYTPKLISLSKPLTILNNESQVKDVILHEIAHALTPGEGHSMVWKRMAKSIGCCGERCYSSSKIVTPQSKYSAVCVGCGYTHKKHKKPKYISSCGFCSKSVFNPKFKLEYKPNF
jgi:predicted SprT family Zn-dependent metalloprotease